MSVSSGIIPRCADIGQEAHDELCGLCLAGSALTADEDRLGGWGGNIVDGREVGVFTAREDGVDRPGHLGKCVMENGQGRARRTQQVLERLGFLPRR